MSNMEMRTTPGSTSFQGSDAPLAHRRPGYSLSGCVPAEPDAASRGNSTGAIQPGQLNRGNSTVSFLDARRKYSWTSESCLEKSTVAWFCGLVGCWYATVG